jgi:pimeloyl-ACP methyl ester carboxylesterase
MVAVHKEIAQYLQIGNERIYAITFGCENPQAKVLLCGPSPTNRLYSLASWARWARFLAQHNFAAIRFDHRGTGESTGNFVEMTFAHWLEDVQQLAAWADSQLGKSPLILHGMGMGGLLAQKVFSTGQGDALLLWSPAARASDIVNQALIMRVSMDMVQSPPESRKSAQDYLSDLKSGTPFEAEGYYWSSGLWESAREINLDTAYARPAEGLEGQRPWRHIALGSELVPLAPSRKLQRPMHPRARGNSDQPLNPDFNAFFEMNTDWLLSSLANAGPP